MITQANIKSMLLPLFTEWMANIGQGRFPIHFMYFRDGVSEGQYQHVIQQEVKHIKALWRELDSTPELLNFKKVGLLSWKERFYLLSI